jgi:hypothetical protein
MKYPHQFKWTGLCKFLGIKSVGILHAGGDTANSVDGYLLGFFKK